MSNEKEEGTKPATLAAWKKAKRHYITLPSGTIVGIEIPDLPALIKAGQIPNDLIDAALGAVQGQRITRDLIEQQPEFYSKLVTIAVKEPAITEDDYPDIPYEDKELIVEIATRQRDLDAVGHHIAGLHKSSDFRAFRGLASSYEDLESL